MGDPRSIQDGTSRCPIVPLSWDKNISLSHCLFVSGQGQEQKSRDKLLCPPKKQKKEKDVLQQVKEIQKKERTF
jgi:hypothetical protein